jgi:hypothetical protein
MDAQTVQNIQDASMHARSVLSPSQLRGLEKHTYKTSGYSILDTVWLTPDTQADEIRCIRRGSGIAVHCGGHSPTVPCLLAASRLFDYLSIRC